MYAPKFKSWLSDEDRFRAVLHRMIDDRCAEAREECAQMVADAMKPLQQADAAWKAYDDAYSAYLRSLSNSRAQFNAMANIGNKVQRQQGLSGWYPLLGIGDPCPELTKRGG